MLFMTIMTWEPEKREELIKRFAQKTTVSSGKIIGQWLDIGGGRHFRVVDSDDPKGMAEVNFLANDVAKVEVIPLIETGEFMKLLASKK